MYADEHVHLLAMAAARRSVDCTAPAIGGVLAALAAAPEGEWVRGWGWDDALVAERRAPTTAEIDEAVGGRPAVLHHRTGKLVALSSAAQRALGATSGLVPASDPALERVPRMAREQLEAALGEVSAALSAVGVVAVTDATVTNDHRACAFLLGAPLAQDVTVMVGVDHLDGMRHGGRIGHAKVMPGWGPPVAAAVARAHDAGFPAAVHAVDVDEVEAAIAAFEVSPPPPGTRDRIEHLGLCLPEHVPRIARLGVIVVSQPSFLVHRERKYRDELSEVEHGWLYRVRSLLEAGIDVRLSSDAPVVPADPHDIAHAAAHRPFAPAEAIAEATALDLMRRPV